MTPIYNEAANLDEFFRRLHAVLERLAVATKSYASTTAAPTKPLRV